MRDNFTRILHFALFSSRPMLAGDKGSFTDRNDPQIALFATLPFREGNETDCSHRKTRVKSVIRHVHGSMLIHLIGAYNNCWIYLYYVTINGNVQKKNRQTFGKYEFTVQEKFRKGEKNIFAKDISD